MSADEQTGDASIVGVWEVDAPGAPFERHVMTFHADGTMLQANPDGGRLDVSDSLGMGVWRSGEPGVVVGRFVEVSAARPDGTFAGRTSVRNLHA